MTTKHPYPHQLKYRITQTDYAALRARLSEAALEEGGARSVHTLLFDSYRSRTPALTDGGPDPRFSIHYFDDDPTYLLLERHVDLHSDGAMVTEAECRALLAGETDWVLNLASREYSRAVEPHLPPGVGYLTCTFGQWKDGRVVEKGTACKMARGQMVRWLAENQIKKPDELRAFDQLGYQFCRSTSVGNHTAYLWIQSRKD